MKGTIAVLKDTDKGNVFIKVHTEGEEVDGVQFPGTTYRFFAKSTTKKVGDSIELPMDKFEHYQQKYTPKEGNLAGKELTLNYLRPKR
jgi:hypothetical protein